MVGRWHLHRAGILNVYQYGDETIDLAGGRLLLRGVNGSGKSTAMNMLLPFLLEADVRRIDAAGEQTGVLRSWMLTGREEPNPVGYLWIEFARTDPQTNESSYLVCGCGIRASASTDRVTTWWFVTDRRPGIDYSLLDRRTPLSVDALRSAIGSHAVFVHERRSDYRAEVRSRLFGGADLDQHIRLLHVVRSPRVGDRIDVDLPLYLESALPQLSDAALADAAQPLEDLDEHRDNVAALRRTTDALQGLTAVYQNYARNELRSRAAYTADLHAAVRRARRDQETANATALAAANELGKADFEVKRLDAEDGRLEAELQALRERPAYRDGTDLVHLREHVGSLAEAARSAGVDAEEFRRRQGDAATRVVSARQNYDAAMVELHALLDEIGAAGSQWQISPVPPVPGVATSFETEPTVGEITVPTAATLDLSSLKSALTKGIAGAELRRTDIAEVVVLLDAVERLENELRIAEGHHRRSIAAAEAADLELSVKRDDRRNAEESWRTNAHIWLAGISKLEHAGIGANDSAIHEVNTEIDRPDLVGGLSSIMRTLSNLVQAVADRHRRTEAEIQARLEQQREHETQCRSIVQALAKATFPEPPMHAWQRSQRRVVLAEAIDFAPDVSPEIQLGIEAAMEASGLLGAELLPSGGIALTSGELVIVAHDPAEMPLSRYVTALDGNEEVTAILNGITTRLPNADEETLDRVSKARTMISTTGDFQVGALQGRHQKSVVEHIGVVSRRAALERRRADAAASLADAEDQVRTALTLLRECRARVDSADEHRNKLPLTNEILAAVAASDAALNVCERANAATFEAERSVREAEADHSEKLAEGHRIAANRQLPFERKQLRLGDDTLHSFIADCRSADPRLRTTETSFQRWVGAVEAWRDAAADHVERQERSRIRDAEHRQQRARLVTLEDTVGTAWAEVMEIIEATEGDRSATRESLQRARDTSKHAAAEQSRTAEVLRTKGTTVIESEQRCAASLPGLNATLAVRGLVASAISVPTIPSWSSVNDSADGARSLATEIERVIPVPERADVGADGVRQSLRQRRENLGAGWDAEDHQSDANLPMAIIVTGPLGRMPLADASAEVASQLQQQSSLLTAKQDQALRNLLQGVVATEVAEKLFRAGELVKLMNKRLSTVKTAHGIGASLRWTRRSEIDADLAGMVDVLAKSPDLRTADEEALLASSLSARIDAARREDPEATYRDLIAQVLDYRSWHEMAVLVHRPGENPRQLAKHPRLSEGEKKVVSYLPLFAAVAASCDALAERSATAPRFLLLDDAFAKVSEDNHGPLFGLLVELDLDFIATSERLWGTHASVPELAICEVVRDAAMSTIFLERARWNGRALQVSVDNPTFHTNIP
jgi:uncharacterized protein (TIGR02680 family)